MLRKFSKYNNWANSLLLTALKENESLVPGSCIRLFSHIVNAQTIWVARINGFVPAVTVWQVHDLETCALLLEKSADALAQIAYPDIPDSRIITYKTFAGDSYETAVADILLHVCNHGTYHRAQIAKDMKLNNLEPVNTDYIQFIRLH